MELKDLVRPNIWSLKGYSSARHEFEGEAEVYLDANENPYETNVNRYPDPFQMKVKERLSQIKNVPVENIFVGNGSDEAIDLIMRIFCEPGRDNILTFPPTYGMYSVSADINNVEIIESSLLTDYQIDIDNTLSEINANTKVAFICSPNNPTGNQIDTQSIDTFLEKFKGITVIDEAYIDFATEKGYANLINKYPRLIVLQTLSKAWGAAGIRFGLAYANEEIMQLINKVKPPYNVNVLTQQKALAILNDEEAFNVKLDEIIAERIKLEKALADISLIQKIHPSDANFLLVQFGEALEVFHYLRSKGIVIRDRTKTHLCADCLRVTVGTPEENQRLLSALRAFENGLNS